jgi:hypothetical protein
MPGALSNSAAVGNISGDYPDEVEITYDVRTSQLGKVRLIRRSDGADVEDWPLVIDDRVTTSPALARLEGSSDEYGDIVIGTRGYRLYAVNADKDTIYPFPLLVFGLPNSPVIGDIDGDGKSETILSSDDGYLHVWTNHNSFCLPHTLEWPQFHHDYQRTGLYGWIGSLLPGSVVNPKELTPGSPTTTISLNLEMELSTQVNVYDSEGNKVRTLVEQILASGLHHVAWDGTSDNLTPLPNGLYFIKIEIRNETKIIPIRINR